MRIEQFENTNRKSERFAFEDLLEEHEGTSYYSLLKKIPDELVKKHLEIITRKALTEEDTLHYFQELLGKRDEAMTKSHISDDMLSALSERPEDEIFEHLDTDVLKSPDIGFGQTARVKKFEFTKGDLRVPIAVKYLVSPTSKTLSASSEHDMLHEVERVQAIEELERDTEFKYVRVPHPYFHHQTEKVQCYGMELIDGVNLQEIMENIVSDEQLNHFKERVAMIPLDALLAELETFLKKMHGYCLHGDIKPRNFMLDTEGKMYLIDFGQSVLATDISEDSIQQFENLKDDEIANTKTIMRMLYKHLK